MRDPCTMSNVYEMCGLIGCIKADSVYCVFIRSFFILLGMVASVRRGGRSGDM